MAQHRLLAGAFPKESRVRNGFARMRLVRTPGALEVRFAVIRTVVRLEALHAHPGLIQRPVHCQTVALKQAAPPGQANRLAQKCLGRAVRKEPQPVLREHRVVEKVVVPIQAREPPEQDVHHDLLAKRPLDSDAAQSLEHQSPKQYPGRNPGWPTGLY